MTTPETRTVVFDCQVFQTGAWGRGMGRYMQEFLRAFAAENTAYGRVVVLLNANMPCSPERLEAIQALSPDIVVECVPLPVRSTKPHEMVPRRKRYVEALTRYVQRLGGEVDFVISSLFMFECFAEYPRGTGKGVVLYDLIPFIYWETFSDHYPLDEYFMRFRQMLEADHIFAISQAVRDDVVRLLGIGPERVSSIDGACIGRTSDHSVHRTEDLGLTKPFIVLPTGSLPHKNNRLALAAFAELNAEFGGKFQLAVTSHFKLAEQRRLQAYSPDAVFVGNVSDDVLHELYERAVAVMCPSEYEGLGLPVLEAVAQNKPMVCSRIRVFEEISKDAFYFFDPLSRAQAVDALRNAIAGVDWEGKRALYAKIEEHYQWPETAKAALAHMPFARREQLAAMPTVAIVAPHPALAPRAEAIVQQLVARTWGKVRIVVYFDAGFVHEKMRPSFLQYALVPKVLTSLDRKKAATYDQVLYIFDADAPDCMGTLLKSLELPANALLIGDVEAATSYAELVEGGHLPASFVLAETQLSGGIKAKGYDPARLLATLVKSQHQLMAIDANIDALHKRWAPEVPLAALPGTATSGDLARTTEEITAIIQSKPRGRTT